MRLFNNFLKLEINILFLNNGLGIREEEDVVVSSGLETGM